MPVVATTRRGGIPAHAPYAGASIASPSPAIAARRVICMPSLSLHRSIWIGIAREVVNVIAKHLQKYGEVQRVRGIGEAIPMASAARMRVPMAFGKKPLKVRSAGAWNVANTGFVLVGWRFL